LDDLPAGGTKTNRSTFPRIGTATIHRSNLIGKGGGVNGGPHGWAETSTASR